MDAKRYQRLKELVGQALDLPEYERDYFLQVNCDDPELLAEARDLLHFHGSEPEGLPGNVVLSADLPDLISNQVGPYQILDPLGEGGMGVVYLAAQSAPLRRKVALKVIKLGMDTREVIARFESERQALAMMDHPNIAKVFDAGATSEGRPYFVMEYIPGVPLNRYCQDKGLGLRERLDLFIQVCRGVQHAHQKGIIHRDLKPGNILVAEIEGKAVPKIIDFGVAKATTPNLAGQTLFTRMGQMIGTPEYMSPEQAGSSMTDVDTRSDVYSLGVLLYEMLTGGLPLERRDILQAGLQKMALHVQNEVPPKPSTRIDTQLRKTDSTLGHSPRDSHTWSRQVRGDLDWITMKALEKDRDRRYGSVADLGADLTRHLEGRAVAAGPPSSIYRMGKFVRRNRLGVGFVATLLTALVGFAIWQTIQSQIISRERDKALANERLSNAREHVVTDPTLALAYALSSLELLDQPAARNVVRQAVTSGPLRNELPRWGQRGNPLSVDVSPDGKSCVVVWSQSVNPTVGVYSLEDYSMRVFKAPSEGVAYTVVFNSDGSYVVAWGNDGVHVWRVADGQHILHLPSLSMENYFSSTPYRTDDPHKMVLSANTPGEPTTWFQIDLPEGSLRHLGSSRGHSDYEGNQTRAINPSATWLMDFDGQDVYLQRFEDLDTDRAIKVCRHEAQVSAVIMDASCKTGVSMDVQGSIKVWDLSATPPHLTREFQETPGTWFLKFDQYGSRFLASWGSETVRVYDLDEAPRRGTLQLPGSFFWSHEAASLPDRSLITTYNGGDFPVVHWQKGYPIAWSLDLNETSGSCPFPVISGDGQVLYLWETGGKVSGRPLVEGQVKGIGSLGENSGWIMGATMNMIADRKGNRLLTYCVSGPELLDLSGGVTQVLPGMEAEFCPQVLSRSGRFLGLRNLSQNEKFKIFDLEAMETLCEVDLGNPDYQDFCFSGDSTLVALGLDHIALFDIANPTAKPDTLWRGAAENGGLLFDEGRSSAVFGADLRVFWVDLTSGTEVELDVRCIPGRFLSDYHPGLGLLAVGNMGNRDGIGVFDLEKDKSWTLPFPAGEKNSALLSLSFDPLGRWLMSWHTGQMLAWTLPLDPLLGEMEYKNLLDSLRSRTNVRVIPDQTKDNGFRVGNFTAPDL